MCSASSRSLRCQFYAKLTQTVGHGVIDSYANYYWSDNSRDKIASEIQAGDAVCLQLIQTISTTSADEWKPDTCSNPIEPRDQQEAQTFGEPLLDTPMRSHRSTE